MIVTTKQRAELQALYDRIPKVHCKKLCQDYCTMIDASEVEHRLIAQVAGQRIHCQNGLQCGFLKAGLCSIYNVRPMICRLFGAAQFLQCPHGCKPERLLSKEEGYGLLLEAEKILGARPRSDLVTYLLKFAARDTYNMEERKGLPHQEA